MDAYRAIVDKREMQFVTKIKIKTGFAAPLT